MIKDENVLVVRRSLFEQLGAFQGIRFDVDTCMDGFFETDENCFFSIRSQCEDDPSLKQIIPYLLVTCQGKTLRYQRGKGGDSRLVSKRSIGIGGHINDQDRLCSDYRYDRLAYMFAIHRELNEEIEIPLPVSIDPVALINDDSNPVGSVHLGIVHRVELRRPEAYKKEEAILDLAFLTPNELSDERDTLETWSQICVDNLERILEG